MRYPPPKKFLEIGAQWLQYLQAVRNRSAATADKYGAFLTRFDEYCTSTNVDPCNATAADLEQFAGVVLHKAGLCPRSRRPAVSALRGFFNWAQRRGHLRANPAHDLPYPAIGLRLPRAISLANAERVLMQPNIDTFIGLRDATMIALLYNCGPRLAGLVGINQGDLIWSNPGELTIRLCEKGKKERLVPAGLELAVLMRVYLASPELLAIDRTTKNGDQVLFISTRNRKIPPHEYHGEARRLASRSFHDNYQKHCAAARVPKDQRNPHAARHMVGAEMAESDVSVRIQQVMLGHAGLDSLQVYDHLAVRKLRKVMDAANPVAKMRAPILDSLRELAKHSARALPLDA